MTNYPAKEVNGGTFPDVTASVTQNKYHDSWTRRSLDPPASLKFSNSESHSV